MLTMLRTYLVWSSRVHGISAAVPVRIEPALALGHGTDPPSAPASSPHSTAPSNPRPRPDRIARHRFALLSLAATWRRSTSSPG